MEPRTLLRAEGLLVGGGTTILYALQGRSLIVFLLLILVPDVGMAGYLHSRRVGALTYNAVHTYVGPGMLAAGGVVLGSGLAIGISLIWTAHIGADRLFGFGLKYRDREFGDTHIQRL